MAFFQCDSIEHETRDCRGEECGTVLAMLRLGQLSGEITGMMQCCAFTKFTLHFQGQLSTWSCWWMYKVRYRVNDSPPPPPPRGTFSYFQLNDSNCQVHITLIKNALLWLLTGLIGILPPAVQCCDWAKTELAGSWSGDAEGSLLLQSYYGIYDHIWCRAPYQEQHKLSNRRATLQLAPSFPPPLLVLFFHG